MSPAEVGLCDWEQWSPSDLGCTDCPECGGAGGYLGRLGLASWFRCRMCGWDYRVGGR
jgi:hypothetical protein